MDVVFVVHLDGSVSVYGPFHGQKAAELVEEYRRVMPHDSWQTLGSARVINGKGLREVINANR